MKEQRQHDQAVAAGDTTAPASVFVSDPAQTPEDHLLKRLAASFYRVVPQELQTYCVLTAEIARRTLSHFGLAAQLEPCQLWCVTPERSCVLGFLGLATHAHKWDGHVTCRVGPWLLDTATFHVQREFHLPAPQVALVRAFTHPTQALARATLVPHQDLWWLRPPGNVSPLLPQEPEAVVAQYATQLVDALQSGERPAGR